MTHAGGRPRKWTSAQAMYDAAEEYFARCDARTDAKGDAWPEPYTVQGCAVALNLTMDGWSEYEKREEFSSTVKRIKLRIEANKARRLLDGTGYGAGHIFDLKHNHGWKDTQTVEHTGGVHVHFDRDDEGL